MLKRVSLFLSLIIFSSFCYCQEIRLGIISGIYGKPVLETQEKFQDKLQNEYSVLLSSYSDSKEIVFSFLTKDIDIAMVPANIAYGLQQSDIADVKLLCCTQNVNLYLVTNSKKVRKLTDLYGKTVYLSITNQEIKNELDKHLDEVNEQSESKIIYDYSLTNQQVITALEEGSIEYAILPEPYVKVLTEKNNKIKRCFNQRELLENEIPLMMLITTKTFYNENEEGIKKLLNFFEEAINEADKNNKFAYYNYNFELYEN